MLTNNVGIGSQWFTLKMGIVDVKIRECKLDQNLHQKLSKYLAVGSRVAVMGIGQELCGDDAAGIIAVRMLQQLLQSSDQWFVIDAGSCPENYTGMLRRIRPDKLILIDAAHLTTEPGSIHVLDWRTSSGISASTHTLPLKLLCSYLSQAIGCEILLIVIQAGNTNFGMKISDTVEDSAQNVAWMLAQFAPNPASPVME